MRVVVVGGGISGLASARRLEALLPEAEVVLVEAEPRLGGKIVTERVDGLVIEGAPDSFLSRKERGVGLVEELGLAGELIGRRPENARTFVRVGGELHPLPSGLSGMVPTDLDALEGSSLLTDEGRERLAAEVDLPPAPPGEDESIASFATRRLGPEAYDRIVEPLMTGIFGGDGERLSLRATFPSLRAAELEHGSVLRGLRAQPVSAGSHPPFVSLAPGMDRLVSVLAGSLDRTKVRISTRARALRPASHAYEVELDGERIKTDGVVIATPAHATAELLADVDAELAGQHEEIPYGSSAIVTLAYRAVDVARPLDGYGYVIPRSEGSDVLACTWTSSKWPGRAPADRVLVRVYAGRHGQRDVTSETDDALLALARDEVARVGVRAEPVLGRIHRWPRGMPQYVLGHPDRVARIEEIAAEWAGLAVAGAAYSGVGIPDCIRSGEEAAESVARAVAGALR